MNKIKSLLLIAAACLTLSACTTKEGTMDDLRKLQTEVTTNSDNFTLDQWKSFLADYAKADSLLNTFELTPEEREEVEKIKKQCSLYVLKGKAKVKIGEVKDAINDAINGTNDRVEDAKNAVNDAVDNAANAVNDAVNGAADAVKNTLNGNKK